MSGSPNKPTSGLLQRQLLLRSTVLGAVVLVVHFLVTLFFYILDAGASISAASGSGLEESRAQHLDHMLRLLVPLASEHCSLGEALVRLVLSSIIYGIVVGVVTYIVGEQRK